MAPLGTLSHMFNMYGSDHAVGDIYSTCILERDNRFINSGEELYGSILDWCTSNNMGLFGGYVGAHGLHKYNSGAECLGRYSLFGNFTCLLDLDPGLIWHALVFHEHLRFKIIYN